jgi:hypothetical protein
MSVTMADVVERRMRHAAQQLGAADPTPYVGELIERSFHLPPGHAAYAANSLTPGAVPFEPSYSEREPHVLRFTIEPIGAGSSPVSRRDEATRAMRGLVGAQFGRDALRWFDGRSEEWRGMGSPSNLGYGAWFGTAYDHDGLHSSKMYYELQPRQLEALPVMLGTLVRMAQETMPQLLPVFTSISCGRNSGKQRITFMHQGQLRLAELGPLMQRLGLGHQLPSMMQIVGLALGGRFDLPERSFLLGLSETGEGPEVKLEILLPSLPDVPPMFLDLLALGLAERPRELRALGRWLQAFTPESQDWPGDFTVLSVRATPLTPARVSLYLRPAEFEIRRRLSDVSRLQSAAAR